MPPNSKPIVFHYEGSIFSHRVLWYLWLRGIPYDECIQPALLPRPALTQLGVHYRKVPILGLGNHIYCDSRFILSKLETLYPNSALAPPTPFDTGITNLFASWTADGGVFAAAVKMIPYWHEQSFLQNEAFVDDREKLFGRRFTPDTMARERPEGAQALLHAFELLERTFLADGRDWVLGTGRPSLADLEAVWPVKWLVREPTMTGSLPEECFGKARFPRVYAWVDRFVEHVETARRNLGQDVASLDGQAVAERTLPAEAPEDFVFEKGDPLGIEKGELVEVFPSDYGQMGRSVGQLVGLDTGEVVIRNQERVYVHFPRWNFTVRKVAVEG
ncbi:glutathione S-transferase [Decorospora gaudefroyi]|uniref:Glutathione S-transferase n=1 Tax=Decorospora gaudefroyi TaxID=184978 RepID=A0A6A5KEK6_9PLEO|nr:glutathione S-transferase [Decorospora gaudefroyi]